MSKSKTSDETTPKATAARKRIEDLKTEFRSLISDPDNLIAVAFFVRDAGQIAVIGDVAGAGFGLSADNVWDAVESLDTMFRVRDVEIGEQFGEDTVRMERSEEEMIAKTAAIESLRQEISSNSGIVDVKDRPSGIVVVVRDEGGFKGPWEWEGYSVYAEMAS